MTRAKRSVAIAGAVGALSILMLTSPSVFAAPASVSIDGFRFMPSSATVLAGETVTWTNHDPTQHTATADGGTFDTGVMSRGQSRTITFANAGTFPYHCAIHGAMQGTVVVQAPATARPTPVPTIAPTPQPATPSPATPPPATSAPTPTPTQAPTPTAAPSTAAPAPSAEGGGTAARSPSVDVAGSSTSPVAAVTRGDSEAEAGPGPVLVAGAAVAIGALALLALVLARRGPGG